MISAKLASLRSLFGTFLLLLLAACVDQRAGTGVPAPDSAPLAVDLGRSSRTPHIAGRAGEGEGYGTVQPAPTGYASMAGMSHEAAKPTAQTSMPVTDHKAMDRGSTSSTNHSDSGRSSVALAQVDLIEGSGTINSVDPSSRKINLSHNPIAAIGWPAMTMDFAVAPSVGLGTIKPGTQVSFTIERGGDGTYIIRSITPAPGGH